MPFERTLAEVLNAHKDALKDDIKKVIPATVTAVNPAKQTVDVKIAVKNPLFDEQGKASFEDSQGFSDVPLACMRGGGFFVWMPVTVGDSVLLLFSDLSMDSWRQSTPGSDAVQPTWVGKHTADSPIAIPCIAPDASFLTDPIAASGKVIIGKNGNTAQIRISDTDIVLGVGATAAVALATKIDSLINILTATYTPAGPETGFAALVTALATWKGSNWTGTPTVGATKVKGL